MKNTIQLDPFAYTMGVICKSAPPKGVTNGYLAVGTVQGMIITVWSWLPEWIWVLHCMAVPWQGVYLKELLLTFLLLLYFKCRKFRFPLLELESVVLLHLDKKWNIDRPSIGWSRYNITVYIRRTEELKTGCFRLSHNTRKEMIEKRYPEP